MERRCVKPLDVSSWNNFFLQEKNQSVENFEAFLISKGLSGQYFQTGDSVPIPPLKNTLYTKNEVIFAIFWFWQKSDGHLCVPQKDNVNDADNVNNANNF